MLAASLVTASQAAARDWPMAAGWAIVEVQGGCAMGLDYEGQGATTLVFILGTDGTNTLTLTNSGWSTREGQAYPLRYVLNGVVYEGGDSIGFRSGYRNGFATRLAPNFISDLAAGSSLRIYNGEDLVDQLSLSGTAAAIGVLRRCVAHVRAEGIAAERDRQRLAHIPVDPFATPTVQRAPVSSTSARPAQLRSGSISDADYPAAALRARAQGTVTVQYRVSAEGVVHGCAVVGSSGDATLDSTTCSLIERRFRFSPARDSGGNPTPETRTQRVRWSLPVDPPPPVPAVLEPARHWVQVGSGTGPAIAQQLTLLRRRAPALLNRRQAYVAADGDSLRLLIGPFLSTEEAAAFASQLQTQGVSAAIWDSTEGEIIMTLAQRPPR